mmetsp:Transcript_58857/g.138632  ORF Transcript_58857/g.138632 Transcript_58857/m.138632 type:complete len:162 (-) Transcript_58857:407-892(-)
MERDEVERDRVGLPELPEHADAKDTASPYTPPCPKLFADWAVSVKRELPVATLVVVCSDDAQQATDILGTALGEQVFTPHQLLGDDPALAVLPPWLLDWLVLSRVDVAAVSNSTFATSAALANTCVAPEHWPWEHRFFRPELQGRALVGFDPWASLPLLTK